MSKENSNLWDKIKVGLIVLSVVLVFVLGILGYRDTTGEDFSFFGAVYSTICLFLMGNADPVVPSPYLLVAQYLAAVLFSLGIFALVFDRVMNAVNIVRIRFKYRDHVVVFHLNTIGQKITEELLAKGYRVVAVEADPENPFIHQIREKGGIVLIGQGTDGKTLGNAGIYLARTCIIAGESDKGNMEVANEILFFRAKQKNEESLKILLHIADNNNINILKDYLDIHNQDEDYDLETFNVWQLAARKLYDLYPPHLYLNHSVTEEQTIAIVGYNRAAEEFLLENIILSHYPEAGNLRIYLVDREAETHFNNFLFQYPFCREYIDLVPVKLHNASFYANFAWSKADIEKLSQASVVYMFGDSDSELLSTSANLRQFLYNQTGSISQVPVVLCLPEDAGITDLLNANRDAKTNASFVFSKKLNIQLYHMVSDSCTTESLLEHSELIDKLSKIINYYYSVKYEFSYELKEHWNIDNASSLVSQAEQLMLNLAESDEKLSDRVIQKAVIRFLSEQTNVHYNSLYSRLSIEKRWNILTHRKKDSNRYAARQLALKFHTLKRIGCEPLNTENIRRYYGRIAPMEHTRWSAEKMVFNYKYGVLPSDKQERYILKDILKIHDQLIPYDKLTEGEKEKDLNLFLLLPLLDRLNTPN